MDIEVEKQYLIEGASSYNNRVHRMIEVISIDDYDITYKVLDISYKATLIEHITDFKKNWKIINEI